MSILLLVALTVGAPFQDVQNRFSVDLPQGWFFSPQPGDTGGVYFRRVNDGILANATVRIMQFPGPVSLDAFAARIGAASDQEVGFHLLAHETVTLHNVAAIKRRFVVAINGDRQWSKVVEQRIMVVGTTGYVVHAETLADAYGGFASDFTKFFESFNAGAVETPVPIPVPKKIRRVDPRALVGTWEGGGHSLHLSPGGVVVLDGLHGTYRLDSGVLVFTLSTDQRIHEFQLRGEYLRLSGGEFGDGQVFRHPKAAGKDAKP